MCFLYYINLFGQHVVLTFLVMFLYLYAKEHNWEKENLVYNIFYTWWKSFKISQKFRKIFVLSFYAAMILLRTVLNREVWFDSLCNILGGWGLYNKKWFINNRSDRKFYAVCSIFYFSFMGIS